MQIALLSGGVGGARFARALATAGADLSVIVNVGDDDVIHGLDLSPDLDTVVYTLAGIEGPHGWGQADDSHAVMDALSRLGDNTTFTVGDRDLATSISRTVARGQGVPLSAVTRRIAAAHGVSTPIFPATDDLLRTEVLLDDGWVSFQEYFVHRRHADPVREISYRGAVESRPAPGVIAAIGDADVVAIGPSNPPLSIWPILSIPGIADAVAEHGTVVAISPLFGGRALKGPADIVMDALGLPAGNEGVVAAYEGLLTDLVIDRGDAADRARLSGPDLRVHVADTRIGDPAQAKEFGQWLLGLLSN